MVHPICGSHMIEHECSATVQITDLQCIHTTQPQKCFLKIDGLMLFWRSQTG